MKQAIHTNDHTNTQGKQRGWRQYWGYTFLPMGIGAFFAYWMNRPIIEVEYEEIKSDPCDCGPEEVIDSRHVPYYYDTPIDWPVRDEGANSDTTYKKHEWFYVDLPRDNHLPEETMEFLPVREEGGTAMGP